MEDYILRPEEPGSSLYFADTRTGSHIGRTIPDIAHENGLSVGEMAVRLLESELPDLALIYRRGISSEAFENEVRRTVTHPAWSLTSDGFTMANALIPEVMVRSRGFFEWWCVNSMC